MRSEPHYFLRPTLAILISLPMALLGWPWSAVSAQDSKPPAPPPTPVVVAMAREVVEAARATYTGFLEPLEQARVSALEAGYIRSISKRSGDRVKRGDALAVLSNPQMLLDLDVAEAQVKESEATLAEARLRLRRLRTLHEKQLIPAEQYENEQAATAVAEARLGTAHATRDRLRARLKLLIVRSPIDGQVITAPLELGQWVTQNTELYEISSFDRIQLRVGVPGRFVNSVPEGAPVEIEVPEIGARLTGRIRAVVRQVDTASGNFIVRIFVDNPRGLPVSGLLGKATLPTGSPAKVKVVPRDAIVRRGEATQVVVVRDGAAQVVPVTVTGGIRDDVIVVADQLAAGEQVVIQGNERLFPGMPVSVTAAR